MLPLAAAALAADPPPVACGAEHHVLQRLDRGECVIDAVDARGKTVTHHHAHDLAVLRELLARGAPVDVPDHAGRTPLGAAARGYRDGPDLATLELLVAAGARLDPEDAVAPLCFAQPASARWLLDHGASPTPRGCVPIVEAAWWPEQLELLAAAGADTSQAALDDALWTAVDQRRTGGLQWLVDHGADLQQRAVDGTSLPWLATKHERFGLELALALREAGARPGPRPLDRDPYAVVAVRAWGVRPEVARLLEVADRGEPDARGRPAPEIFAAEGRDEAARLLRGEPEPAEPPPPPPAPRRGGPPDPLLLAIAVGDVAKVRALLAAGADPDGGGESPLVAALGPEVWQGRLAADGIPDAYVQVMAPAPAEDLFTLLLEAGADPNRCAPACPLGVAAGAGLLGRVEQLLAAGADLTAEAPRAGDALCQAARAGRVAVVEALLARGAAPGGAARCAAAGGAAATLEVLARAGAPLDAETLAAAIVPGAGSDDDGRAAVLRVVLDHGVPVDAPAADGATALARALGASRADLAAVLLERGADPRRQAPGEPPPIASAAWMPDPPLLRALVAAGADPDSRDAAGRTLLERALSEQRGEGIEPVPTLLALGADPDARGADGRPLLHLALEGSPDEVLAALLAAGPDLEARSPDGLTPLHAAVRAARRHLDWPNDAQRARVVALLAAGVDPDPRAVDGTTPLQLAADQGDEVLVRALLDAGARPRRRRDDGLRAVDVACRHTDPEVRALLAPRGCP